jgi:hypothetical protein
MAFLVGALKSHLDGVFVDPLEGAVTAGGVVVEVSNDAVHSQQIVLSDASWFEKPQKVEGGLHRGGGGNKEDGELHFGE